METPQNGCIAGHLDPPLFASAVAPTVNAETAEWPGSHRTSRRHSYRGQSLCQASADLLGQPDEKPFGPPDVAEPIHVFVLDHVADELGTALAEPSEGVVDVVHGEHDPQVAESVDRGVPVIGDRRRREKSRELEP